MRTRMRLRVLIVAAFVATLVVAIAGVAQAHALLKSSDPAAGAELASPPPQIVLTFTEPPDPKLSSIGLISSSGGTVKTGPSHAVPAHPTELAQSLPNLPDGVYTVSWRTVSLTDGHVTGGSFAFGVGVAPPSGTGS